MLETSVTRESDTLHVADERYNLSTYEDVILLGTGNAAGQAGRYLEGLLDDVLTGGVIVTDDPVPMTQVDVVTGTHPIPSDVNVTGARRLLELAEACGEDTLVLVVVSGGGSALLAAPAGDVELGDLQVLTDELLASGAPITAINTVRRHVSDVKGGRLAAALAPATVVGLMFSDVTSGDPAVVASGPLSGDETTYEDARDVLARYDVDAPERVVSHLDAGAAGVVHETPEPGTDSVSAARVHVLADNATALDAAAATCADDGYDPLILSSSVRGEAREAALTHVAIAEECLRSGSPVTPPAAILSGGETTVTIRGDGTGGPNQEFALRAAIELPDGVVLGAVDTDGTDGPTDAAGALVSSEIVHDTETAHRALADNDVLPYLDARDALLRSGQTGTNVNDLRVLVITENAPPDK